MDISAASPVFVPRGHCDPATVTCVCEERFVGPACGSCLEGFVGVRCDLACPRGRSGLVCSDVGTCVAAARAAAAVCMCSGDRCGPACEFRGTECFQPTLQCAGVDGGCSGHGTCASDGSDSGRGHCYCDPDWAGSACEHHCSCQHGLCFHDAECLCDPGWAGPDCTVECPGGAATPCGVMTSTGLVSRGRCDDGSRGTGTCECFDDQLWAGSTCTEPCPGIVVIDGARRPCSGHGTCNPDGSSCRCVVSTDYGRWAGEICDRCAEGWGGVSCTTECRSGSTVGVHCACPANWYGSDCGQECPGRTVAGTYCGGRGTCNDGAHGDGSCACQEGYFGASCATYCRVDVNCSFYRASSVNCTEAGCTCIDDPVLGHWAGEGCADCGRGYWGSSCTEPCNCGNQQYSCNRNVGTCSCYDDAANGHWTGATCDECAEGWIGVSCKDPEVGITRVGESRALFADVYSNVRTASLVIDKLHGRIIVLSTPPAVFTFGEGVQYSEPLTGVMRGWVGKIVTAFLSGEFMLVINSYAQSGDADVSSFEVVQLLRSELKPLYRFPLNPYGLPDSASRRPASLATPGKLVGSVAVQDSTYVVYHVDSGVVVHVLRLTQNTIGQPERLSVIGVIDLAQHLTEAAEVVALEDNTVVIGGHRNGMNDLVVCLPSADFRSFDRVVSARDRSPPFASTIGRADERNLTKMVTHATFVFFTLKQGTLLSLVRLNIPFILSVRDIDLSQVFSANPFLDTTQRFEVTRVSLDSSQNSGYVLVRFLNASGTDLPTSAFKFDIVTGEVGGSLRFSYYAGRVEDMVDLVTLPELRMNLVLPSTPFVRLVQLNSYAVTSVVPNVLDRAAGGVTRLTVHGSGFVPGISLSKAYCKLMGKFLPVEQVNATTVVCVAVSLEGAEALESCAGSPIQVGMLDSSRLSGNPVLVRTIGSASLLAVEPFYARRAFVRDQVIAVRGFGFDDNPHLLCMWRQKTATTSCGVAATLTVSARFISTVRVDCVYPGVSDDARQKVGAKYTGCPGEAFDDLPPTRDQYSLSISQDGSYFPAASLTFAVLGDPKGLVLATDVHVGSQQAPDLLSSISVIAKEEAAVPPIVVASTDAQGQVLAKYSSDFDQESRMVDLTVAAADCQVDWRQVHVCSATAGQCAPPPGGYVPVFVGNEAGVAIKRQMVAGLSNYTGLLIRRPLVGWCKLTFSAVVAGAPAVAHLTVTILAGAPYRLLVAYPNQVLWDEADGPKYANQLGQVAFTDASGSAAEIKLIDVAGNFVPLGPTAAVELEWTPDPGRWARNYTAGRQRRLADETRNAWTLSDVALTAVHGVSYRLHISAPGVPDLLTPPVLLKSCCEPVVPEQGGEGIPILAVRDRIPVCVLHGVPHTDQCKLCPTGGICNGSWWVGVDEGFWREPVFESAYLLRTNGFWNQTNERDLALRLHTSFYECIMPGACPGGNRTTCKAGHAGTLCNVCQSGYGRSSLECAPCMDASANAALVVVILAFLFLLVAGLEATASRSNQAGSFSVFIVFFKQVLGHLQMAAAASGGISVAWPWLIRRVTDAAIMVLTMHENVGPLNCVSDTGFYQKSFMILLAPVATTGVLFVSITVYRQCRSRGEDAAEDSDDERTQVRSRATEAGADGEEAVLGSRRKVLLPGAPLPRRLRAELDRRHVARRRAEQKRLLMEVSAEKLDIVAVRSPQSAVSVRAEASGSLRAAESEPGSEYGDMLFSTVSRKRRQGKIRLAKPSNARPGQRFIRIRPPRPGAVDDTPGTPARRLSMWGVRNMGLSEKLAVVRRRHRERSSLSKITKTPRRHEFLSFNLVREEGEDTLVGMMRKAAAKDAVGLSRRSFALASERRDSQDSDVWSWVPREESERPGPSGLSLQLPQLSVNPLVQAAGTSDASSSRSPRPRVSFSNKAAAASEQSRRARPAPQDFKSVDLCAAGDGGPIAAGLVDGVVGVRRQPRSGDSKGSGSASRASAASRDSASSGPNPFSRWIEGSPENPLMAVDEEVEEGSESGSDGSEAVDNDAPFGNYNFPTDTRGTAGGGLRVHTPRYRVSFGGGALSKMFAAGGLASPRVGVEVRVGDEKRESCDVRPTDVLMRKWRMRAAMIGRQQLLLRRTRRFHTPNLPNLVLGHISETQIVTLARPPPTGVSIRPVCDDVFFCPLVLAFSSKSRQSRMTCIGTRPGEFLVSWEVSGPNKDMYHPPVPQTIVIFNRFHTRTLDKIATSVSICLFLTYPTVIYSLAKMYHCIEINGKHYLEADVRYECFDQQWQQWLGINVVGAVVYLVLLPALFVGLMRYHIRRGVRLQGGGLGGQGARGRLGFLYRGYTYDFWYWELVVTLRKALLVITLVTPIPLTHKLYLNQMVFLACVLLNEAVRPWVLDVHHRSERVFLLAQLCLMTLGMMYFSDEKDLEAEGASHRESWTKKIPTRFLTQVAMIATVFGVWCIFLLNLVDLVRFLLLEKAHMERVHRDLVKGEVMPVPDRISAWHAARFFMNQLTGWPEEVFPKTVHKQRMPWNPMVEAEFNELAHIMPEIPLTETRKADLFGDDVSEPGEGGALPGHTRPELVMDGQEEEWWQQVEELVGAIETPATSDVPAPSSSGEEEGSPVDPRQRWLKGVPNDLTRMMPEDQLLQQMEKDRAAGYVSGLEIDPSASGSDSSAGMDVLEAWECGKCKLLNRGGEGDDDECERCGEPRFDVRPDSQGSCQGSAIARRVSLAAVAALAAPDSRSPQSPAASDVGSVRSPGGPSSPRSPNVLLAPRPLRRPSSAPQHRQGSPDWGGSQRSLSGLQPSETPRRSVSFTALPGPPRPRSLAELGIGAMPQEGRADAEEAEPEESPALQTPYTPKHVRTTPLAELPAEAAEGQRRQSPSTEQPPTADHPPVPAEFGAPSTRSPRRGSSWRVQMPTRSSSVTSLRQGAGIVPNPLERSADTPPEKLEQAFDATNPLLALGDASLEECPLDGLVQASRSEGTAATSGLRTSTVEVGCLSETGTAAKTEEQRLAAGHENPLRALMDAADFDDTPPPTVQQQSLTVGPEEPPRLSLATTVDNPLHSLLGSAQRPRSSDLSRSSMGNPLRSLLLPSAESAGSFACITEDSAPATVAQQNLVPRQRSPVLGLLEPEPLRGSVSRPSSNPLRSLLGPSESGGSWRHSLSNPLADLAQSSTASTVAGASAETPPRRSSSGTRAASGVASSGASPTRHSTGARRSASKAQSGRGRRSDDAEQRPANRMQNLPSDVLASTDDNPLADLLGSSLGSSAAARHPTGGAEPAGDDPVATAASEPAASPPGEQAPELRPSSALLVEVFEESMEGSTSEDSPTPAIEPVSRPRRESVGAPGTSAMQRPPLPRPATAPSRVVQADHAERADVAPPVSTAAAWRAGVQENPLAALADLDDDSDDDVDGEEAAQPGA
eukprot:TRINITY_DN15925_c0_g1_i1.p1 TRINITY_DN15925_c0_g1~~TRINITY_DN15925_c0_g1_i1.p1  ORF type:complete len:3757 (+),score=693.87 TRINITY_DN15925_c0_g1_i1:1068-11273(+)